MYTENTIDEDTDSLFPCNGRENKFTQKIIKQKDSSLPKGFTLEAYIELSHGSFELLLGPTVMPLLQELMTINIGGEEKGIEPFSHHKGK